MKDSIISLLAAFEGENIEKSFPLDYCLPVYHCVSSEDLPHLNRIILYKNIKQFEEDLDYLLQHFQFVDWDEFKEYSKGNFKARKKIALLTFDDGLREFYDIITPVLERKGIYAINFINPSFIGNKDLMFRCKASLIFNAVETAKILPPEIRTILQTDYLSKENIQQRILKISYHQREILDQIAEKLELSFTAFLKEQQPYLSFEQLKSLAKKGFGISSHSWDHPLYHELSLAEQLEATEKSFDYLKENNFLYESFAFPFTDFGVKKAFFDQLFKNRDFICSFGSAGIKLDSVTRNFHRIPMETGENAEKIIKKEIAYFRLKKLLSKNTITRK
ncbi:polysaccharide deacetylase family protein [Chryseobacterium populi]|uniref:Putative xylanase/chitin deacetylase n=1 Tax=Chryseobacterium populi TaxID=1144316 RepID=J2KME3_9FLAO|nr:polysaccharide deacetylase family protein [Chryseobacterium populi]EJL74263.1 putative xylanase/chitin deacetylase [Chryseobacterium populi]